MLFLNADWEVGHRSSRNADDPDFADEEDLHLDCFLFFILPQASPRSLRILRRICCKSVERGNRANA